MQTLVRLVAVGPLQSRDFKRNDGSIKKIEFRMLRFTDGFDTFYGETSERLTGQIEASDENLKLRLIEGRLYNVDLTVNARDYEKDGKSSTFVSIVFNKAALVL